MSKVKRFLAAAASVVMLLQAVPATVAYSAEENIYHDDMISFYTQWKDKYIVKDKYVSSEDQYYIDYSGEVYTEGGYSVPVTVSEAHGYGMLITSCLAEYDPKSQDYFDGMYRFYRAHLSDIGPNLMSWQQCGNGTALIDGAEEGSMTGGSCDSASDGDIDIAYSLLIADKIWGSNGDIDYRSAAIAMINDIMKYDVNQKYWTINLGDWVSECDSSDVYYGAVRSSDFILYYLPAFAEATGDENWLKVYDSSYNIINDIAGEYDTGLLPDFIIRDKSSGKYSPSPAEFLESAEDGKYSYNSCRIPWRIAMDYMVNKNESALNEINKLNSFIIESTGGDPEKIASGYSLDGKITDGCDYNDLCFTAPFMVSALYCDDTQWKNRLWDYIVNYGEDSYYGDTIKMLCMIAAADEWVTLSAENSDLKGDVNLDGQITIADYVIMQQSIVKEKVLDNNQLSNADMNSDNTVNIFDSILLKRTVMKKMARENAEAVLAIVNEEREKAGVPPLTINDTLMQAADIRSREIYKEFSHTRPDSTSCFTVLDEVGIKSWNHVGENIAYGSSTAQGVMNQWMNSEGHRKNILSEDFSEIAIGRYKNHWVQLFIG